MSCQLSPASQPHKVFSIKGAFTAKELGLAEHTHPVDTLMTLMSSITSRVCCSRELEQVHPVLLIGSDYPHLITRIEPVRLGPPGGPAATKTRLGWMLQDPAQISKLWSMPPQCYFSLSKAATNNLFSHVERLWQMDVLLWQSPKARTRSKQDQYAVDLLKAETV